MSNIIGIEKKAKENVVTLLRHALERIERGDMVLGIVIAARFERDGFGMMAGLEPQNEAGAVVALEFGAGVAELLSHYLGRFASKGEREKDAPS